jgi:hypothetical protein
MQLVDAIMAIVQEDAPDGWRRYFEIAPRVIRKDRKVPAADAPRELLRDRLQWVSYDLGQRNLREEGSESWRLETDFLSLFVAAVGDHRCHVTGIRGGKGAEEPLPAVLITGETIKGLRGDKWENLGGTTWHGIRAYMGPSPLTPDSELKPANEDRVRAVIRVEYAVCAENGHKPPNVKEIAGPVLIRLRAMGRTASDRLIMRIAGEDEFEALRRKPGKTVASERKRD